MACKVSVTLGFDLVVLVENCHHSVVLLCPAILSYELVVVLAEDGRDGSCFKAAPDVCEF